MNWRPAAAMIAFRRALLDPGRTRPGL